MKRREAVFSWAFFLAAVWLPSAAEAEARLDLIRLPSGFSISLFSGDVPGARSLALGAKGTVFVGTRDEGAVYALTDTDGDGKADERVVIARGLDMPNGVAFRGRDLYVAEIDRVIKFEGIEDRLGHPPAPVVVNGSFPDETTHGWKFIAFGPDGLLYIPVGMPCNICKPDDKRFGTIMRMRPDGSGLEVFAGGIRNTVGFDWSPRDRALWFTDNGQDLLGDDRPPDELNRAPRPGMDFGYPYYDGNMPDPLYGPGPSGRAFAFPVRELGPHVAALGMRFYTGTMFPERYRGQIFIAEHGSWNRTEPIGYRITLVKVKGDRAVSYDVFAEGWLQRNGPWGRPVDVQPMPDGSLLVSDDKAGAVYRISYQRPKRGG
ncbi:MAG: PQQ-dependent sugar dehydrogenase [Deltaproteobacteria bacterium]